MPRPAIRIEGLSKRYRIGARQDRPDTLVGAVTSAVRRPLANLRRLRRLSHFGDDDTADVLWALRDVSLDVAEGEVVGLIGRNGAGKTTLLKVLSRITSPTAGRIELGGRVASLLEVGTGFHPELTGRENIYLNGTILGMKKAEVDAKLAEIVEFSGIEPFIDTPLKRYSSGMAVRLAFSVAAHLEPEILLIDEVLAVGDADFRKKCLGKMQDVAEHGRTVLFVSHNMAAVNQLCERSIWLEAGRVVSAGPTAEVVGEYLTSGSPEAGERSWPDDERAPGGPDVRLLGVRVRSSGAVATTVGVERAVQLEIDYRIVEPVRNLRVGVHLLTSLGAVAFCSGDQKAVEEGSAVRPAGYYRSICTIPPHLLNAMTYAVTVIADVPFERLIVRQDAVLSFHVERTASDQGIYPEAPSTAVFAPTLDWRIERVDPERESETGARSLPYR